MRTHPDDPSVVETSLIDIRTQKLIDLVSNVCLGCPHHADGCPGDEDEARSCGAGMVWFGHHIYIANKLEGKQ